MTITVATKEQLPIVRDLAYKIWPDTYGTILSEVQLDFMLDKFYSIANLEEQMLEKNQVFMLIQNEEKYLGFCAYELNIDNSNKTKLHKIYVLPETQGTGVGKLLLEKVEEIAKNAGDSHLILNVNRFNKAQEFYKYKGFLITEEVDIEIGHGYLMEDYIMEKQL
ncbi:GNAT family N-acetyltransferase [Flavobacterium sp.]|uniref:GNAT family N-acetyltransferase n=1 Tax=Flavobacterium sp. TaxID=239 RepID=UPI002635EF60|nr:GNAT family N-acetyltransferase [Flavobacterium sp.]